MSRDDSPEYWETYTNLQRIKHQLIRDYLNGWFPKLGLSNRRIIYFDTHAGRGEYRTGERGSPIVALETFLSHNFRNRILRDCEVGFYFIEHDEGNVSYLRSKIAELGDLPDGVVVDVSCSNCFDRLRQILNSLTESSGRIAPAFGFIDPYGFKIPHDIVRDLMAQQGMELFTNIIWRELDMGISQAIDQDSGGMVDTLDSIFGGRKWRELSREVPHDLRADRAVEILRNEYGATWSTSIRMLGDNNVTRYILAHYTNKDSGRDLMKDCLWKACPDGRFIARRSDNPEQFLLIEPTPDLSGLESWLDEHLVSGPIRWSELENDLKHTLWRKMHLWSIIRKRRREERIIASHHEGKFSQTANPLISLPAEDKE